MRKRHQSKHHGACPNYLVMISIGIFSGFLLGLQTRSFIMPCDPPFESMHDFSDTFLKPESQDRVDEAQPHSQTHYFPASNITSGHKPKRDLLLVGVMTARKYLNSRTVAVYNTWATKIPGKVIFFSCAGSDVDFPPGIPVVSLPGVDDVYPPQKKAFMMLKYMYDHYKGQYEYYMRADDDVYIRGDRLTEFLHSVNSTKMVYVGQAGQGNKEDIGKLNMEGQENFCMGGPGMVLSHTLMSKVGPRISYCMKNLYTHHEDVELGRCVYMVTGVFCTWAFEMQQLFLNNYKDPNGSFIEPLKTKDILGAITLHPIKNHTYQYRMHHHFHMVRIAEIRQDLLRLHREIHSMNEILQDRDAFYSPNRLGLPPSLLKTVPKSHDEVLPWDFITTSIFSLKSKNPRRGLEISLRSGLEDVVRQTMEMINKNARQRGRTIDFQKILYGYHRVNPLHGVDYVLDLLLVYKKHKGKRRMTVPVRRHAYLQQTFAPVEFIEEEAFADASSSKKQPKETMIGPQSRQPAFFDIIQKKIGDFYGGKDEEPTIPQEVLRPSVPVIHFILPLAGRFQTFLQFMHNFEEVCLQQNNKVELVVMLYRSELEDRMESTIDVVRSLQRKYHQHSLRVVQMEGAFSRGLALTEGSLLFTTDTLMFFIDVDIYLHRDVLYRITQNVVQHRQVYYPVVFSHYDPSMTCSDRDCTEPNSPFTFTLDKGYWRQFGYGIAGMYKSDFSAVGGFDTGIQGWGKEDVDLYEKFLAKNMTVFRSADPGMVHIFHAVSCDPQLDSAQYQMCLGSKAATFGSTARLADFVYKAPEILYRNEQEPDIDTEDEAPRETNNNNGRQIQQNNINIANLEHR